MPNDLAKVTGLLIATCSGHVLEMLFSQAFYLYPANSQSLVSSFREVHVKKSEEEANERVFFLYIIDVKTSLSRRMKEMVFQDRFPSSISRYEVWFLTTTMTTCPPSSTFFFISAVAQWTGLAIHKLFRRGHTFSPLCDTLDVDEGESYSFLSAHIACQRSWKPCFSWHNFLLTFLLFEASGNLRRDCVPAWHGESSWHVDTFEANSLKEKKKNEFRPCFFNYNFIIARDSDVSVSQLLIA